ncbi:MAG TPA: hypothetical protein VF056_11670, partial [Thermoleophilaceae bacterium]
TTETWFAEYDYDLGRPLAAETRDANGVHRRAFERGLVLVNPTASPLVTNFNGTYTGSGLTNATAATMGPHTGLILQGAEPNVRPERKRGRAAHGGARRMAALATSSRRVVTLRWTRGSPKARRFRVLRNNRVLRVVRRLRTVDRRTGPARVYRYRVVGFNRRGQVVSRSGVVAIRRGRTRSGRRLKVSVAVPKRRSHRVRVDLRGRRGWRRVAERAAVHRRMGFSLPRRPRVVRVVVTSRSDRVIGIRIRR